MFIVIYYYYIVLVDILYVIEYIQNIGIYFFVWGFGIEYGIYFMFFGGNQVIIGVNIFFGVGNFELCYFVFVFFVVCYIYI